RGRPQERRPWASRSGTRRIVSFARPSFLIELPRDQHVIAFANLYDAIGGDIPETLDESRRRPPDDHLVDRRRVIQPEVLPQRVFRAVAVAEHHFANLLRRSDSRG